MQIDLLFEGCSCFLAEFSMTIQKLGQIRCVQPMLVCKVFLAEPRHRGAQSADSLLIDIHFPMIAFR